MTASNLEPTLSSAGGECTREHVTNRVTSEVTHDEPPPKRVTVADKTSDAAREPNDDNNNNSDQCLAGATPTETTCCRASEPILAPTQAVPDQTVTRFNNNSAAATHKQPWHYGQPVQPNAISIYPPAHNFVHYPLASAVPQLAPPPPPFQPPQLSFYHAPPFVTWTCPISGNYQLPLSGGAHYYYAHQAQVQPLVAQHHQLCGAAIYQSATPPTDNNHHQYVTQTTPSDNDDDERQSHGSPTTPINAISTECAGNGSSAAGLDCAHTSKVTPAPRQATQQSDKSLASSSSSSAPLDTAALDSVACGPIQRDDKCRDRAEQQQCELNKISYLNENDNEPASSRSQLEEGVSNAEDDDDNDERGSWRRSSSLCDDDGADTPLANYRAESMHDVEPQAAGTNNSTSCHLHQHRHQNSISSGTKSGVDGDGDRGGTCSPEAGPSGGASQSSAAEQHEDRPRANLMVEPVRGDSGSKFQQEKTAACEEDAGEAKGPEGCGLALFKDANLDEPNESINNNQQLANQPTSESHQISINGTTFYHVDPTRLFLPPPPPPLNQQQQLPFLLSYYGPTNAYHTNQHQLPANNYFQRPVAQPSPYQQSAWCSPPPPTANSHSRLILHPPAPLAVDYPQSWLHHYAPYQHAHMTSYPASQHQYQQSLLFAPSPPYLGGGPNLRPIIYHHHHSHDQAQAQVPPASQSMPAPPVPPTIVSTTSVSQLKLGYNLIPLLPIQAIPTRVRQAYGMDKVWQDEFEQMFAQFISQVVWTLVEVETNPNVRASSRILDYKNRYIVRVDGPAPLLPPPAATKLAPMSSSTSCESSGDDTQEEEEGVKGKQVGQDDEEEEGDEDSSCHGSLNLNQSQLMMMMNERASNSESDCDSGAVLNSSSTSGSTSFETTCCQSDELSNTSSSGDSAAAPNDVRSFTPMTEADGKGAQSTGDANQLVASGARAKFPLKFRMFIDSAKVRFCCETCGHGWTSMKGRVVFWYELFELVDGFGPPPSRSSASYSKHASEQQQHGVSNLIGYCAYKLFGQQCDVCKVENRFERPMWYPEEVTKVLCNLYNKIGQLYFGFRMPTIDKQRRAGKPKTSHNSLLCQACHDGVCTDRK